MSLAEEDAAKIVLIRSVEESDRTFFSASLLVDAFTAAARVAPGLAWVKARAQFLFDHLSPAYQSVLHLVRLPTPLTLPVCSIALIVGFATNLLGSSEHIHIPRNLVLLLLLVTAGRKKRQASSSLPEPTGAKTPVTYPRAAVPEAKITRPRLP